MRGAFVRHYRDHHRRFGHRHCRVGYDGWRKRRRKMVPSTTVAKPTKVPDPTATPFPEITATNLFYEYKMNETRANAYKGKWLTVELYQISRVDGGGKVVKTMDSFGWEKIEMDFKNDADVITAQSGRRCGGCLQAPGMMGMMGGLTGLQGLQVPGAVTTIG